ncbi:hypothetical protein vseg_008449 [Gypsophila vaccaria]
MNADLQEHKPPLPPPSPAPPLQSQPACEDCKLDDRLILHNVARTPRSPPQRLCTSCVLQFYRKSICAECYEPYDVNRLTPPPSTAATTAAMTAGNGRLLWCMRCESWSHGGCPPSHVPKTPYICPPCRSPNNYRSFDLKKISRNKKRCENGEVKNQAIDKAKAKQLLGAARISAITVAKAASAVRVEAERKAKEAALARRRASEAIDHVVAVSVRLDDARRKVLSSTVTGPRAVNYSPVSLERNAGNAAPAL